MRLAHWRGCFERLVSLLASLDAHARVPCHGPAKRASVRDGPHDGAWADGQDIFDTIRLCRIPSRCLRHIGDLCVGTYGWTFVNRKLAIPKPVPYVE